MTGNVPPVNPRLRFGEPVGYANLRPAQIDNASRSSCMVKAPEKLKRFNLQPDGLVTDWLVYERHVNPLIASFEKADILSYPVRQFEKLEKMACTCSYFKAPGERICQHIAEVLIHIEQTEQQNAAS